MKFVQFYYQVTAFIILTKAEHARLMELSARHYDHTCRFISKPGAGSFLYGWSHNYEGKPDDHEEEWQVTSKNLNLLMKILEMAGDNPIDGQLFYLFLTTFRDIQRESRRVNNEPDPLADALKSLEDPKPEVARVVLHVILNGEHYYLSIGDSHGSDRQTMVQEAKQVLKVFVPAAQVAAVFLDMKLTVDAAVLDETGKSTIEAIPSQEERPVLDLFAFVYPRRFEAANTVDGIAALPQPVILSLVGAFKKLSLDGRHDAYALMVERDVVRNFDPPV